jgi:uncharacterized protein with ATP-grasp and redox domains
MISKELPAMAKTRKQTATTPKQKEPKSDDMFVKKEKNPEMDAWLTSFFIENHLDAFTYPDLAASDEQVRFMVYTNDSERYYPCSDQMFEAIVSRKQSALIQKHYNRALQNVLQLIDRQIEDPYEKSYLEALIFNKYKHETRDEIMLPSRLEKRLLSIYMKRTQIADPFGAEKIKRNHRAVTLLKSRAFHEALNYVALEELKDPPDTLEAIKSLIATVELNRLVCLANTNRLWEDDACTSMAPDDLLGIFNQKIIGNGFKPLIEFLGCGRQNSKKRKLLWLADEAGQVVMDMAVIRFLASHGHKIIVAFKGGPLYTKTTMSDVLNDQAFQESMAEAAVVDDTNLSKNELVRTLRGDVDILLLSDNTSENINLLLTSTTFARFFKEVDGVISRGLDQRRRLFETHFQFTQDIYSMAQEADGSVSIMLKTRHPAVIKFSHQDLENKAQTIIDQMKKAKEDGMTVIFYSGIIGSIPGKIEMAKRIMSTFVRHLTEQSAQTFIINPSQYYEPGMDADDLMYMWEIVQRSGQIDIWRFQTYDDIVTSFEILGKKIPPEWVGKDATYSTGCTKEMAIAVDVLKKHPEMQIIGPAKERFMRRQEYGVGKMYDRRLSDRIKGQISYSDA